MQLQINKNFEKVYKHETWKGFTLKETIVVFVVLALTMGIAIGLWYYQGISVDVGVYMAFPFIIPIIAGGFYTYQDMSVRMLMKEWIYCQKTKKLFFAAGEISDEDLPVFTMKSAVYSRKEKKAMKRKKRKGEN